jgi:hypothetical protein
MNAMVGVASRVPIWTMIDRGWPDYTSPSPDHREFGGPGFTRYREYVASGSVKVTRLQPGRNDQLVLVADPQRHPQFEVRNIAANGEVWTGGATSDTRRVFPDLASLAREDWPTENMSSLAIRMS